MPRPRSAPRDRPTTVAETSAGGVVVEERGADRPRVALIGRRTRRGGLEWVLPKGHLEAGETAEDAAVREVEEETGILARVVQPLGTIDYWFMLDGRRVHKTVHHFLLEAQSGALSLDDGEVEQVEWVPLDLAPGRLAHPDERDVALRAGRLLAEPG